MCLRVMIRSMDEIRQDFFRRRLRRHRFTVQKSEVIMPRSLIGKYALVATVSIN